MNILIIIIVIVALFFIYSYLKKLEDRIIDMDVDLANMMDFIGYTEDYAREKARQEMGFYDEQLSEEDKKELFHKHFKNKK